MATILQSDADTASTSYGVLAARRVVDMRDKIYLLEPSAAPLTLLTAKMGKMVAKNPKFDWLEDESMPFVDTLNGTFVTAATALLVDNIAYYHTGMTVQHPSSGEVMLVTGVTATTLTVTRSWGGTVAGTINDAEELLLLGGTAAEGAEAQPSREVKVTNAYNYTEIVRSPFGVSRTVNESELYGGNLLAYLHKARGIDHAKEIERKLFFSERAEVDGTTVITRSTGGLWELISTNSTDYSGTMTAALIDTASADDFRYGSKSKMLFVPRAVASAITTLAHDKVRIEPNDKTFGLRITKWETTHGTYNIVVHDQFVTGTYDEVGVVADLENLGYRFLRNSDTKLRTNIQAPSADGRKDEFLTEMGLERKLEKTHGQWLNCVA